MDFNFKIIKKEPALSEQSESKGKKSRARLGVIATPHGKLKTPVFMPVATTAAIKGLTTKEMKKLGAQILLSNTYHLWLKPGEKIVKKMGGLHKFMNWNGPIITDSGGFQAFSLGYGLEENIGKIAGKGRKIKAQKNKLAKITEEGVKFKSHIDGKPLFLTPEKSVEIQHDLGSDIILVLDECTSPLASYEYTRDSIERSHKWEIKSLKRHKILNNKKKTKSAIFGIVQGGKFEDLRKISAQFVNSQDFDGFAIGGSFGDSYGQTKAEMWKILDVVMPELDEKKPRHLLGIGGVDDFFECIERGVDMFDCVSPTRLARQGLLYISPKTGGSAKNKWRIQIKNAQFKLDKDPIDKTCKCETCQNYSRAYLNHLFKAGEILGIKLATEHNLYFILNLMKEIRKSLEKGEFEKLKKQWIHPVK